MELKVIDTKLCEKHEKWNRRGYTIKPRIYVWPQGETILDNLENRRHRPIKMFRESAKTALKDIGVNIDSLTLRWSQKAGCDCGCSPGFIVEGWDEKISGKDVHIHVTGD